MPEVRPCSYRNVGLVGPWRSVHCRQHRLRPKDRFALTEPMGGISAQFLSTHQSVRLHGTISTIFFQPFAFTGKRIDHFFFGPELEENRINGDQLFCTRDRGWEASFALFLSTSKRRLTADHLDKIFCTRLRSRMGGIFRSVFIYRRASAYC